MPHIETFKKKSSMDERLSQTIDHGHSRSINSTALEDH